MQPKIRIEQTGDRFNQASGAIFYIHATLDGYMGQGGGEIDVPWPMDPASTLRAIAQALTREAARIERENAPLRRPQPAGVKIDGWDV